MIWKFVHINPRLFWYKNINFKNWIVGQPCMTTTPIFYLMFTQFKILTLRESASGLWIFLIFCLQLLKRKVQRQAQNGEGNRGQQTANKSNMYIVSIETMIECWMLFVCGSSPAAARRKKTSTTICAYLQKGLIRYIPSDFVFTPTLSNYLLSTKRYNPQKILVSYWWTGLKFDTLDSEIEATEF